MTIQQVKSLSWEEIIKFIIVGTVKLVGFAIIYWIIRHF